MLAIVPIGIVAFSVCAPGNVANAVPVETPVHTPTPAPVHASLTRAATSDSSKDAPESSGISFAVIRDFAFDSLEGLSVGPTFSLVRQASPTLTAPGRGTSVSLTPGVVLPNRIVGYHDLWTRQFTPDLIANAQRYVTTRDSLDGLVDLQSRSTAVQASFIWTHTMSLHADRFLSYSSPNPVGATYRAGYRALALGSDIWPLPKLPLRVEVGMRTIPARPQLYFSFGYAPRHLPKPKAPVTTQAAPPATTPPAGSQG